MGIDLAVGGDSIELLKVLGPRALNYFLNPKTGGDMNYLAKLTIKVGLRTMFNCSHIRLKKSDDCSLN